MINQELAIASKVFIATKVDNFVLFGTEDTIEFRKRLNPNNDKSPFHEDSTLIEDYNPNLNLDMGMFYFHCMWMKVKPNIQEKILKNLRIKNSITAIHFLLTFPNQFIIEILKEYGFKGEIWVN